MGGVIINLARRPPFTPRKIPGTYLCYGLRRTQGHGSAGRIMSIEKCNYLIGNQTRDLPACSTVPQPTTLMRAHRLIHKQYILSRVYGSVTNNNGFWIGWLDLLPPSCTISLNHNQLQKLTINYCLRFASFPFSCSFWFESESELLYDWRFTVNQFVLASSPLRLTTRDFFFQLSLCGNSPYVTFSLTRRWVCLIWICFAFCQVLRVPHIACYCEFFFLH
jgi:hypothetical protein